MYPSDRTFLNIVFIFHPRKETWKYPADIVNRDLAWFLFFLILSQVFSDVICHNVFYIFFHFIKHRFNSRLIIFERFLKTPFYPFFRQKLLHVVLFWTLFLILFLCYLVLCKSILQNLLQFFTLCIVQIYGNISWTISLIRFFFTVNSPLFFRERLTGAEVPPILTPGTHKSYGTHYFI